MRGHAHYADELMSAIVAKRLSRPIGRLGNASVT
jgi:hypothetical protein